MNQRRKQYPFDKIEAKWQARWDEARTFHAPNPGEPGFDPAKPKYYVLDMFPYPSGAGLHVGHPEGYTATDIITRYKRMRGFNVLHPMGWDAFGLPAEQYAIKTGQHPRVTTEQNVARFKTQLKAIGFAYDWDREINTTDPGYYRWTQWIFLQLYNAWFNPDTNKAEPIAAYRDGNPDSVRLAYVAEVPVNWCPALGTVLANEEVVDGKSEVGGFPVERRPMRQWMLRITAFADRLIDELGGLDWPDSIKTLQANWIGRSEGAEVHFEIAPTAEPLPGEHVKSAQIIVFTTRPDTLFGATYMVLAPEHRLVDFVTTEEQWPAVRDYRERTARKSDLERTELTKEKTGVFTGGYAINPVNGEEVPIWIADYVLLGYGTGAIMAVPAHDERDLDFARKFDLPVRVVVAELVDEQRNNVQSAINSGDFADYAPEPIGQRGFQHSNCFAGEGVAINSPIINGLPTPDAKKMITGWLEETGAGRRAVNYKLRDWLFSRQRYWGEPFPVVWRNGNHEGLPETELPVTPPPLDDFKPSGTPEPPLAKVVDWVRYSENAVRETNTMPQWAGSCWYYLRYCDPRNGRRFVGEAAERYWMTGSAEDAESGRRGDAEIPSANPQSAIRNPQSKGGVDLYVGGTEHAVLHLLYARFWHKALFDLGHVSTPEPFQRLVNQGIILGEDGQKMSKSRGNVINPEAVIAGYGADAFRLYEMFMGPLEQMKPWSMTGVEGVYRFLARVWRLMMEETQTGEWALSGAVAEADLTRKQLKVVHATIKKVTQDIETLSFNTAIPEMMKLVNEFTNATVRPVAALRVLLQLLNPFAPHLTEELWEALGARFSGFGAPLADQSWPEWAEDYLTEDEIELVIQVNGKLRDKILVRAGASREELETAALGSPKIVELLAGGTPLQKVIVVPGKLVNLVL